jgi:putative ABC transport system permease protein
MNSESPRPADGLEAGPSGVEKRAAPRDDWKAELRARLAHLDLSPPREAEIIEELGLHLEDRWRDLVAGGVDPVEAERLTRAGPRGDNLLARYLAPLRQAHWSDPAPPTPRRWFALGGLRTDVRDAIRSLRSAPAFTGVALIVLTLGMGATTAIFSVVDAVALRPLPFDKPGELVAVGERPSPASKLAMAPSPMSDPEALRFVQPQNYLDWAAQQQVFSSIAAVASNEVTYFPTGGEPGRRCRAASRAFFDVLRIRPAIGRTFGSEAEIDGRHRVAVLSEALWRTRFGGDPGIIGRTIVLDGGSYEVVGVLAAGVSYPVGAAQATDLWVPCVIPAGDRVRGRGHSVYLQVVARLRPGVSLMQSQAGMEQIAAGIEKRRSDWNRGFGIGVRPLQDHLVGASIRSWMLMLLAAVGMVLLIASANVANLLLARASARATEVAVRAALGAGRWRLVRQFIVESLVLSVAHCWPCLLPVGDRDSGSAMPEGLPRVTTTG